MRFLQKISLFQPAQFLRRFSVSGSLCAGENNNNKIPVEMWLDHHERSFGHFINNKFYKPKSSREIYKTKSPSTGNILASTLQGNRDDIDLAVKTANEAAVKWAQLPGFARACHLFNVAREVERHRNLFSLVESLDNGKCVGESYNVDVPMMIRHLEYHAGAAQLMDDFFNKKWKPHGVVGVVLPFNFPLMHLSWKVGPAWAMGNTVVYKPATYTRLSALLFAEICAQAGLPPGVFNVVTGDAEMGSMLASHPDIDKVSFTGSVETGQILRRLTAGSGKPLTVEVGGKSPFIVHETADLDQAADGIMVSIYFNQGQVCCAGSRLIVHESVHDQLVEKIKERLAKFKVGDSLDKAVNMGPLVDEKQWQTVENYVQSARKEGATVFQSWSSLPESYRTTDEEIAASGNLFKRKGPGLFYPPTIITKIDPKSKAVVEEIFGPVLVVIPFKTADEALKIANDTRYGLGASVWTKNLSVGLETCLNFKAGFVWLNGHNMFDSPSGFGGYKLSGYGRDGGFEGLIDYVKPAWQKNFRGVQHTNVDLEAFGNRPEDKNAPMFSNTTTRLFYGGRERFPNNTTTKAVHHAKTNEVVGHVSDAIEYDVLKALISAVDAAPIWGKRGAFNRAKILYNLATFIDHHRQRIASKLSAMSGEDEAKSLREVDLSTERAFYWAGYADKYGGDVQETLMYGCTIKVHEPLGVIAIACPDEFPLLSFVSLLAPAIVRGNTVIITPSERFPLAATELFSAFETNEIPSGVISVLTGNRDYITRILAKHDKVDGCWYFGSAEGSHFVEAMSANNLKRTWVSYGRPRAWDDNEQATGLELLYHANQVKNIWIPIKDSFLASKK